MDDLLTRWCRFTANHANSLLYLIIIVDLLLSSNLYFNSHVFEFTEPLRGFESRGSSLSNRINSWKLLTGKHHSVDHLTLYPRSGNVVNITIQPKVDSEIAKVDEEEENEKKRLAGERMNQTGAKRTRISSSVTGFCGDMSESYVQFVLEPQDKILQSSNIDLFSLDLIEATCQLDSKIRTLPYFTSNCVIREDENDCCQSWSLPNLILKAFNKSNCNEITVMQIHQLKELIDLCHKDYQQHKLTQDCASSPQSCRGVPERCYENGDLVFNLIHFILSADYVSKGKPFSTRLVHANLFLPLAKSSQLMPFFHQLEDLLQEQESSFVTIGAYDLGLKEVIFEKLLVEDLKLLIFAFTSILVIFLVYTSSFWATGLIIVNLFATLGGSLFIYQHILGIQFFPFMNLMSAIILIAVGGDSVFIIYRSWQIELNDDPQQPLERLLSNLIQRTFLSTLCSSVTTSCALLATSVSQITSLKCFSIYSAIAVALMYVLTLISLPVVMSHRAGRVNGFKHWMYLLRDPLGPSHSSSGSSSSVSTLTPPKLLTGTFCTIYKYTAITLMFCLTVTSLAIFLTQVHLPTSEHFSTLDERHPFEKFDVKYRDLFKFSQRQGDNQAAYGLPIKFVFGIEATDQGSHLNPDERGSLTFDREFDLSRPDSQQWLLNFCHKLHTASFYAPAHGPLLSNCFIDTLKSVIGERKCYDEITEESYRPCCNESVFPYSSDTFDRCLPSAMDLLHRTPTYTISRDGPGVLFWQDNSTVATLVVQHTTNYSLSSSYGATKKTLASMQKWLESAAEDAPTGLKSVWFITDHLELFALQESLIDGTYWSVMLALILAFITFILATRNIILTLFATVTTSAIILSTLSTLIYWFNWEINVVESVVFSIAIGISVDLPLHLVIGYQKNGMVNLCNQTWMTARELFPALLAACCTTALGGLWMTASHILAYQRLGTFLVTISGFNFLFTFVLLPGLLLTLEKSSLSSSHQSGQSEFLGRADLALS